MAVLCDMEGQDQYRKDQRDIKGGGGVEDKTWGKTSMVPARREAVVMAVWRDKAGQDQQRKSHRNSAGAGGVEEEANKLNTPDI